MDKEIFVSIMQKEGFGPVAIERSWAMCPIREVLTPEDVRKFASRVRSKAAELLFSVEDVDHFMVKGKGH